MVIVHATTSDGPDAQPWPPSNFNGLWVVVRRTGGRTLWRAIQLLKSDELRRTFASPKAATATEEGLT
jgi:hypothetical protein